MSLKTATIVIALLTLIYPYSFGRNVKDMGNIWVVTIDKSGSMIKGKTVETLGDDVYKRLITGICLNDADFKSDRFLFLTSGYAYSKEIGLGNELKSSPAFDKSFIHKTDGQLHSFSSRAECASHIRKLILKGDFSYPLSFVSQIRVFSLIHAVNYLKSTGEGENFNQIKVLTITDDADQNDQWMMDYRLLKMCAPNKIQEVNDSTAKYVYNSLNGLGEGYLDCIFSDEDNVPHIWVYDYKTKASVNNTVEQDMINIGTTDGVTIILESKYDELGDAIVDKFFIDSIYVNNTKIPVSGEFKDQITWPCSYDNKYVTNDICIWGNVQVEYEDPVYGSHIKMMPFTIQRTVISDGLEKLLVIIISLLGIAVCVIMFFLFIIRPNKTMFTIYSGLGEKTRVKRGFLSHWKSVNTPIQYYQSNVEDDKKNSVLGCITRKSKYIDVIQVYSLKSNPMALMIVSGTPLSLSVGVTYTDTSMDIEKDFQSRKANYPYLLKEIYEPSYICSLYRKKYKSSHSGFYRFIINIVNALAKKYFYCIPSVSDTNRILIEADRLLKDKTFSIDYYQKTEKIGFNPHNYVINLALSCYYRKIKNIYDVIICNYYSESRNCLSVVQLDDITQIGMSLNHVRSYLFFEMDKKADNEQILLLKRYLSKQFKGCRIGYVEVRDTAEIPFDFIVRKSTAPGFITFVEYSDRQRSQQLYSPYREFETSEKFIRLNPRLDNGRLYLSVIPFDRLKKYPSMKKVLSDKVINNEVKNSLLLTLGGNGLSLGETQMSYLK